MCGVAVRLRGVAGGQVAGAGTNKEDATWLAIQQQLARRGPDHQGSIQVLCGHAALDLTASLLQLRGHSSAVCPLEEPASGSILLYNGELFGGGVSVQPGQNDGQQLLAALVVAASQPGSMGQNSVLNVLNSLRGPWTVVFWHPTSATLWFGRDVMGRRSLLAHWPHGCGGERVGGSQGQGAGAGGGCDLILTSVAPPRPVRAAAAAAAVTTCTATDSTTATAAATTCGLTPIDPEASSCPHPSSQDHHRNNPQTGTGGSKGEGDGGSKGEGDGEEEEGGGAAFGPGAGAPGVWQEVPPGVYTLQLKSSTALPTTKTSNISCMEGTGEAISSGDTTTIGGSADCSNGSVHAQCMLPDQAGESPQGEVLYDSHAAGIAVGGREDGREHWVLTHYPWTDPELQALSEYSRPECLVDPGNRDGGVVEEEKLGGGAGKDNSGDNGHTTPFPPGAGAAVGDARCASTSQTEEGEEVVSSKAKRAGNRDGTVAGALRRAAAVSGKGDKGGGADHPGPHPDTVDAVLGALREAVRVRCKCIERCDAGPTSSVTPATPVAAASSSGASCHTPGGPASAAPIMILFSGGVDSTLIAALAHQCLPPDVPIDLSNVCFDGGRSPDRLAARSALAELAAYAPSRAWRLVEVDRTLEDVDKHKDHILDLLHPAGTIMDLNIGAALWLAAGGEGTLRLPPHRSTQHESQHRERDGRGCESRAADGLRDDAWESPGAPNQGLLEGQAYRSGARVVMLGHGADEQCAGYGRHRTRFVSGGWCGLARELGVDMRRLWVRNLGRDDRLVADWGREGRHPFLDEAFMGLLLRGVELQQVADLRNAPGVGDKHVLRAALAALGLPQAAARVKRAIQFGSRIGKASNVREFGSNRKANKRNAGSVSLEALAITAPTAAAVVK